MNEIVSRLIEILTLEMGVNEALLRLSTTKREAIVGNAVSNLDKIVREEQALTSKLADLEKQRLQSCTAKFAAKAYRIPSSVTISDFIKVGSPEQAKEITKLQEQMGQLIANLQKENDLNSKLINSRLEYINAMVSSMDVGQPSNMYGSGGNNSQDRRPKTHIFDSKV